MTGILGFVSNNDSSDNAARIAAMARAMAFEHSCQIDHDSGSDWALGRVTFNGASAQPVWNENHTICLVMEGELYGTDELRKQLTRRGREFRNQDDSELLLRLFLENEDRFVDDLNGAFTVAIYDLSRHRLLVATDFLGQRPLYYTHYGGSFVFAGKMAALLADSYLPRQLDGTAIAQLLAFEHVLGDRTLLSGVKLVPPGTVMAVEGGRALMRQYWTMKFPVTFPFRADEDYLEELGFQTRRAVARQGNGSQPAVQMLSGGLDSRQLLGALAEIQPASRPDTLHTLTMGQKNCSDRQPAAEIARKAKAGHRFFELTPSIVPIVARAAVHRLDGLKSFIHAHAMAPWLMRSEPQQIVFKGFLGDKVWTDRQYSSQYDDEAFQRMLWQRTLVLFDETEQRSLLLPSMRRLSDQTLAESFQTTIKQYTDPTVADRFAHFIISERQRRFIQYGVEGVRTQHIVRTPFADRDYVEFAVRIPTHLRVDRQIQLSAVVQMYPELAKVPWELTGLPMAPCIRDSTKRLNNSIRWTLRNLGLSWVPVWQRRPIADYDGWMRGPLRPWVEGVLFDRKTSARGLYNPNYVRKVVTEHMAGKDLSRRLSMLITLELWFREFLD